MMNVCELIHVFYQTFPKGELTSYFDDVEVLLEVNIDGVPYRIDDYLRCQRRDGAGSVEKNMSAKLMRSRADILESDGK
jgi:hypothetical protein